MNIALGLVNACFKHGQHLLPQFTKLPKAIGDFIKFVPCTYKNAVEDSFSNRLTAFRLTQNGDNAFKLLSCGAINGYSAFASILWKLDDARNAFNTRLTGASDFTIDPRSFDKVSSISSIASIITIIPGISGLSKIFGGSFNQLGLGLGVSGKIFSLFAKTLNLPMKLFLGLTSKLGFCLDLGISLIGKLFGLQGKNPNFAGILGNHYIYKHSTLAWRYLNKYFLIDINKSSGGIADWGMGGTRLLYDNNPNSPNYGLSASGSKGYVARLRQYQTGEMSQNYFYNWSERLFKGVQKIVVG